MERSSLVAATKGRLTPHVTIMSKVRPGSDVGPGGQVSMAVTRPVGAAKSLAVKLAGPSANMAAG